MNEKEPDLPGETSAALDRPWVICPPPRNAAEVPPPEQLYRVYAAVIAPGVLSLAALVAAFSVTAWWLVAIPFIWLGSMCAQPNLNLVDGCLTYLSASVALIVLGFHPASGIAILAGVVAGYIFGFIEKMMRMHPVAADDR